MKANNKQRQCPGWFTKLLDMATDGNEQQKSWARHELMQSVAELHHRASTRYREERDAISSIAVLLNAVDPGFSSRSTANSVKVEIAAIVCGHRSKTRELLKRRMAEQDARAAAKENK